MAQWGERSPPTNTARVQFQPVAISGLSLLLVLSLLQWSLFLRVLQYSSFHTKKPTLQIPERSTRIKDPNENHLRLMRLPLYFYCSNIFENN